MSQSPSDLPGSSPPARANDDHHAPTIARNARYGLWLFAIYVVFYAGFVALCAFAFKTMGTTVAGVNLAIVYGLGLILLAFILAIIYMRLVRYGSNGASNGREGRA